MSQRRFGLRLRVLATLSGAAGLCGALLSVLLLLRTRDEIARSHLALARRDLRAAAAAVEERCVGDVECARAEAARSGVSWEPACVEAELARLPLVPVTFVFDVAASLIVRVPRPMYAATSAAAVSVTEAESPDVRTPKSLPLVPA